MQTRASNKHRAVREPPPTASAGPKPKDAVPRSSNAAAMEGSTSPPFFCCCIPHSWSPSHVSVSKFPPILLHVSFPQDNLQRCFPDPWADKENQRLLLSHCWPDAAQSFKVWGHLTKRHSNVRGHRRRHRESLLQAQAAPLKMDSSSPSKHTDLQQYPRSGSIWKAKTKHIPFRNKTRLNPSLPFSFKIQVYRVVSGRSKSPCPPPLPKAKPGAERTATAPESFASALWTFHHPLDSFLTLLPLSACKNLFKRE